MMNKVIKHRLDVWKEEPLYWDLISGIDKRLYESTISKTLIDIFKIRVSQTINAPIVSIITRRMP